MSSLLFFTETTDSYRLSSYRAAVYPG